MQLTTEKVGLPEQIIAVTLVIGFALSAGIICGFLGFNWASYILSFFIFSITFFVGSIAYLEEFKRPKKDPVSVRALDQDELDDGEFAFHVENVTGERISGGSRFAVMPRNLTKDGQSIDLYRFGQGSVGSFLFGDDSAIDSALTGNCPMYCDSPAPHTDDWRGPWATYLPSEGGDKIKRISTHPFGYYQIIAQNIFNRIRQTTENRDMNVDMEDRVESLVDEYNSQLPREAKKEFSIEFDPDHLVQCVAECLSQPLTCTMRMK